MATNPKLWKRSEIQNGWKKQDKLCTYNVTMMRVRATIVVVEKQ